MDNVRKELNYKHANTVQAEERSLAGLVTFVEVLDYLVEQDVAGHDNNASRDSAWNG